MGQTRCCVAGMLTIAMVKYGHCFGYDWKFTDAKPTVEKNRLPSISMNHGKTYVSIYKTNGQRQDYKTIKDACIANGITSRFRADKLESVLKKNGLRVYIRKN